MLSRVAWASLFAVAVTSASPTVSAQDAVAQAVARPVDGIRLRGGLSLSGGGFLAFPRGETGGSMAAGGAGGLSLRLGVQFVHAFSLMVQSTPWLGAIATGSGAVGMAGVANSVLANVTLADLFEVGLGPSFDVGAAFGCDINALECADWAGFAMGAHGRVALVIGGRWPHTARRSGLSISVDVHPMFQFDGVVLMTLAAGVGVDWY